MHFMEFLVTFLQGYEGEPPILLKEEPEDGPRNFQKVPCLSDLSEESLGECRTSTLIVASRGIIKT